AAVLGGVLADRHFGLLFVIDAITTLAYGALVLVGVPETRPGLLLWLQAARAAAPRHPSFFAPFRNRRFMAFVLIQVLLLLAFRQVLLALPLDMRAHGLGTKQIGWLMALNGLFIVIGQPITLRYLRGWSHVQWLAAGAALTGLGLGGTALAG